MNTFASYLLTANLLLVLGYAAYHWLYQKEENFQFNRLFLLLISFVAWLIPLFPWSSWVASAPELSFVSAPLMDTWTFSGEVLPDLVAKANPTDALPVSISMDSLTVLLSVLGMIYLAISGTLLIRFLVSLVTLFRLVRRFPRAQMEDHVLLHADREINPFSFFKMIILNPNSYQKEQYELIYQHELVHARQWHNLDILIAELWCIVSWFNPLTWKMKQQIRQNLEFIADAEVLKNGANRKVYQYCLLRLNVTNKQQIQIANHFNQSLLKKRIIMMNRKKSPDTFSLKHLLLFPLLIAMVAISLPLHAQKGQTQYGPNSRTDHPADSKTDHPGEMEEFETAPVMDGESVYGIVRAELTMETLELMKKEFARRGVTLEATNINFTGKGKLSSIRLEMEQWNKMSVTKELNNKLGPIKDLIYIAFQHNKADNSVIMSMDTKLPSKDLTDSHKKLLEQFTGIAIISESGDICMKGILDLKGEGDSLFKSLKKAKK